MTKQLIIILMLICFCGGIAVAETQDQEPVKSNGAATSNLAAMPQAERDYIAIVEKARKQYSAGRSNDARKGARVGLQIDVHQFMGLTHIATNWTGIYKGGKLTDDGDRSITIEIAPGILIATWDNRYFDSQSDTMIASYSPVGRMLNTLAIGDPVIFSGNLIGSVVSTDDDMVRRPQIITRFTELKKGS